MSRIWRIRISTFKLSVRDGGDCYARYLVRMREMLESLKILEQAIENIPGGPVNVDAATRCGAARRSRPCIEASRG